MQALQLSSLKKQGYSPSGDVEWCFEATAKFLDGYRAWKQRLVRDAGICRRTNKFSEEKYSRSSAILGVVLYYAVCENCTLTTYI